MDFRNLPVLVEVTQKQAVYQGRLAESRFANYHKREIESPLHRLPMHLFGQRCESDIIPVSLEQIT